MEWEKIRAGHPPDQGFILGNTRSSYSSRKANNPMKGGQRT